MLHVLGCKVAIVELKYFERDKVFGLKTERCFGFYNQ